MVLLLVSQFEGIDMERLAGTTVVTGVVRDQAQLHGFIERIEELRLELLGDPADRRYRARWRRLTPIVFIGALGVGATRFRQRGWPGPLHGPPR
jgi:hypothetical protein